VDWDRVAQTVVASLISSSIILVVLRFVFERSFEHVLDRKLKEYQHGLDRKLKEYEHGLQERTAVRSKFNEQRSEGYRLLATEIRHTRRALLDCLEPGPSDFRKRIAEYDKATDNLQEVLYSNDQTLGYDGLYESIHTYKVQSKTLVKTFNTVLRFREGNDMVKAETLWQTSQETAEQLLTDADDVVEQLRRTISSVLQGQE
jgi:hypothetical protein